MTTKQWIGIEEAATKYQVSTRRIITWCDEGKFLDDDTVKARDYLFRSRRLSDA